MTVEAAPGIGVLRDTCNVYVLPVAGGGAVAVDAGSGLLFDRLEELGLERITDVLVTHHHRDQVQGLRRAVEHGARVWVPPVEVELVAEVDRHWQSRQIDIDYDLSEDRFSLLDQVPVAGTVDEYRTRAYGGLDVYTLPTPGHTLGSVSYVVELGGRRVGFVGDLLHGEGRVWSLAATQWTYGGIEGLEATIVSLAEVEKRALDLVLPSHGGPAGGIAELRARLGALARLRTAGDWSLEDRLATPFDRITPHLWRNRTTYANSYLLVSDSGRCLGIDFGYDQATWRRPLLWSLDGLDVDAVVVTHYHDDHVAGLNLLRAVRGAEVWAPANVAPILEEPHRHDLPCLWPDPIPVDRTLALGEPVRWREYELTPYAFPGHTRYAAAIAVEVDGRRVLATGDQYATNGSGTVLNYQYRNRFRRDDFVQTAALVRRLRPDLLVSGHWLPHEVDDAYLDALERDALVLERLHEELLPDEGFGEEGFGARIEPYRSRVAPGGELELAVEVVNPFPRPETARVAFVAPEGWSVEPREQEVELGPHGTAAIAARVRVGAVPVRRARLAADLVVGDTRFGQQAEALVDVE
jgi:glyoxylase-like metal-dependent hydrolase (beta-lactamase superfamily II)